MDQLTAGLAPGLDHCRRLLQQGRISEARAALAELAEPLRASAKAQALAGEVALAAGDSRTALESFGRALALDHANARYHLGEARAYLQQAAPEDAEDSLRLALEFDADCLDARFLLADLLHQSARSHEAREVLAEAHERSPQHLDVLLRLARAHNRCGDTEAAVAAYGCVLALEPRNTAANVNLGLIWLLQRGDPHRAEARMRAALDADPGCHEARANLGLALLDQGRCEEAIALYEQALREYPGFQEYRWNLGLAHLLAGRFDKGWDGYALRFEREGGRLKRTFRLPEWDGSDPAGAGILVYGEQGLGDEIMFASCLDDLLAAGARVVLECNSRLQKLFRRAFPTASVYGKERDAADDWVTSAGPLKWQVPIGNLPATFRRSSESFAGRGAYLRADADRIEHYRAILSARSNRPRIGISWRGGTRGTRAALRSLSLEHVAALSTMPCAWVCLQHGLRSEETALAGQMAWADANCGSDLDELAALIASLDAVVTVDNSVAHLAGALGKPTWVLLCSSPDWRWQLRGETTPWYGSARLVRQPAVGDWGSVIRRLREQLASFDPWRASS